MLGSVSFPVLRLRSTFSALAVVATMASAGLAHAQAPTDDATTKAARARFQEGVSLYDKGQYEASRAAFLQAYALRKHPAVLLNLAQSSLRSARPLEAAKYFNQYLRESNTATPAQRADAEKGLAESRTKLGRLEVSAPTGAEVAVDGNTSGTAPLSDAVDVEPGMHTVRARLTDGTTESRSVNARAGEKLQVQLTPAKESPAIVPVPTPTPTPTAPTQTQGQGQSQTVIVNAPAEPERPMASTFEVQPSKKSFAPKYMAPIYVGLGVTLVGAGTAVVFYLFKQDALTSAKSTAKLIQDNGGNSTTCNTSAVATRFVAACKALQDDVDRSNTDNLLANIGFGTAIAGGAFTLGWLFFSPKRDAAPAVGTWTRPIVSPMFGGDTRGLRLEASF